MAIAAAFESLQPEQIPPYRDDSSGVSSTSSKEEDGNIESVIEDSSEEDIQGNFNIKLNYYISYNFIE